MRVIGGAFKKARLYGPGPRNMSIRATYDRVRENVFNLLGDVDGLSFLDLYAGSGGMGIEALSRGARRAVFVDHQPDAIRIIRKNIDTLGLNDRAEVVRADVQRYLHLPPQPERFDVVYIDPPYNSGLFEKTITLLGRGNMLTLDAVVIGEHGAAPEAAEVGSFERKDVRRYGQTWITIWQYIRKG